MQSKQQESRRPRSDAARSAAGREAAGKEKRGPLRDDERHASPGAAHAGSDAGPEEDNNP